MLVKTKKISIFASLFGERYLSSVVEQWTENPCVPGSIPGGTTKKTIPDYRNRFFISSILKKPSYVFIAYEGFSGTRE